MDRAKSLQRIAKVQAEMVKLCEWRVAAADRQIADLAADRARLADYAASEGSLGEALAKMALRSMTTIDRRDSEVRRRCEIEKARLDTLRRRDHAVAAMADAATTAARRAEDARELVLTMEAWLARQQRLSH